MCVELIIVVSDEGVKYTQFFSRFFSKTLKHLLIINLVTIKLINVRKIKRNMFQMLSTTKKL